MPIEDGIGPKIWFCFKLLREDRVSFPGHGVRMVWLHSQSNKGPHIAKLIGHNAVNLIVVKHPAFSASVSCIQTQMEFILVHLQCLQLGHSEDSCGKASIQLVVTQVDGSQVNKVCPA